MIKTAIRGVFAHKLRLALTAMAIVLGVGFVAGTYTFTDTINAGFETLFTDVYAGIDVSVDPVSTDLGAQSEVLPTDLLPAITAVDGVEVAAARVDGYAQLIDSAGAVVGGQGPPTVGMSWIEEPALNALRIAEGNGRPPSGPGEVAIDVATAERAGFAVGDRARIQFDGRSEEFQIVGLADYGTGDSLAGATLATFELTEAQRVLGLEDGYSSILIGAASDVDAAELTERVGAVLPAAAEASTGAEQRRRYLDDVAEGLGFLNVALLAFAGVAVFVGAFIIQNTFRIIVAQRTKELALLRAIGATGRQVVSMVVVEALLVGVVASGIGVAAGVGLSYALRFGMNALGFMIPGGPLTLLPRTVIVAMVVGVVVTLGSAVLPAMRAARVPPMAALRDLEPHRGTRSLRRRALAGLTVAAVGVASLLVGLFADVSHKIVYVGSGSLVVFIGVAALAPLIARPLADGLGWSLPRLFGVAGKLARENTKRQPRRTAATAAALMIGIALVVFVSILAATIKASVRDTVTETFPAVDLTFRSTNGVDSGAPETFTATFTDELRRLPEIGTASAMRFGIARIDGEVVDVTAIETDTITPLYDVKPSTGTVEVITDGGLLIAEATLRDRGWAVGDAVRVEFAATGTETMVIEGTFPDADFGEYLIALPTYEANYPTDQDGLVLAGYAAGVDDGTGRAAVDRLAADYPAVSVQNRAEFIAAAERTIDQMLALFWGLLGVAIVIAVMGITNTLALSIAERTREIGLLRAVGMSRRQVRSMIVGEAVIVALLGAVLGLGLGMFFGWSITTALSDEGLGGLTVPVVQLVAYLGIAGLAGVLAALGPARSAARLNVLRAIGHE